MPKPLLVPTDPKRSPVFRMANHMAGGQLPEEMDRLFAESRSWEEVARVLFAEHGVRVTGQTLRRWAAFFALPDTGTGTSHKRAS